MSRRLFRYILAADNGMAPCIDGGLVTLATCKPQIRRGARPGDWVAGFLPRPHERGLFAYAARVREVVQVGDYERRFSGRSDAIYRELPGGSFQRLRPDYHPDVFHKDLAGPALIFDEDATWYFGDRPQALPPGLDHLAAAGRGHRVNGVEGDDIAALEKWLRSRWPPGAHGRPRDKQAEVRTRRRSC